MKQFVRLVNKISFALVVAISFGSSPFGYAQDSDKDRVYPKVGAAVTGAIQSIDRDGVVIEVRGNNQKFAVQDIARIVYEGEPPLLSRVKELVANGQIDMAVENFKKVDSKTMSREEAKKDYDFYRGYLQAYMALRGQGDPKTAANTLAKFEKENPQSIHYYDAVEQLGDLALALQRPDMAAGYYKSLGSAPYPDAKFRSSYLVGKTLLIQGKLQEAKNAFSEVIAANATNPAAKKMQNMAKVSLIRCDADDKSKAEQAVKDLMAMVMEGDSTDVSLMAIIYNTLGEVNRKEGKNEQATIAFLHTDLLFASESDAHAEALYNLSQLWAAIGDPQRAADAKQRLQDQYGGTPWAKKK